MHGAVLSFFGVITGPTLVRLGEDVILPKGQHTRVNVYCEMIMQIARDYPGLPDVRELTEQQIEFFYDGLRPELRRHTRVKNGKGL